MCMFVCVYDAAARAHAGLGADSVSDDRRLLSPLSQISSDLLFHVFI